MNNAPVISIDGPSGSGKGSIATRIADSLGWHFLDSGALYRILGYMAKHKGASFTDVVNLAAMAGALDIHFDPNGEGEDAIVVDGIPVGLAIRNEEVAALASKVAAIPEVRAALLDKQREFQKSPGLVADGRDMGTVVFPDSELKVFLTATAEERARRRHEQLKEQGINASIRRLFEEIRERDERDRNRTVAPLVPASDAKVIDTTNLTIDQVVAEIEALIRARNLG